MGLSYDDEDSLKESLESLNFNNPPSDPDSHQGVGSSSSMPREEGNEDDPNIILEVPRVAEGSSTGQERSEDIYHQWPSSARFEIQVVQL